MREIQSKGESKGSEWISWHEGAHLISKNPTESRTFNMIIDRLCEYFNIKKQSIGTRFNWYRDSSDWKPFHHDSAAFNPQRSLAPVPALPSPFDSRCPQLWMTENPRKHDVLCGRGGATNSHTGNVEYRSLVQGHQDGYLHAAKSEKKEIARSIVATIRSRGGRFLRKCTDGRVGWLEIGDKKAREKTSQALREGLDAKTLLAKGIVKADLLAEIATTSEGPPPTKRRRRSSDADVASSEAWGGGVGRQLRPMPATRRVGLAWSELGQFPSWCSSESIGVLSLPASSAARGSGWKTPMTTSLARARAGRHGERPCGGWRVWQATRVP